MALLCAARARPWRGQSGFAASVVAALWLGSWLLAEPLAAVGLHLAQPDGTPLGEAVLTAYALDGRPLPPPAPAVMDQRGRRFVPQILVVQTRTRVSFENTDDVLHHVYSFSPARKFQLTLPRIEGKQAIVFDQPGIVTLGCNVHDWMLGYIVVVDTPYFTKTDAAGRAALNGLPPGRYRLEVWHPRITDPPERLRREVTLVGGTEVPWELRLTRPLLPARDQQPTFADY